VEDRACTAPGYDLDLAARVAALARVDPSAVAAVYAAGEAAGRRDAAAYWATALAPLEAAVRRATTTHDMTSYAELTRRRGETWDSDASRWRSPPRPGDRPGRAAHRGKP